MDESSRDSFKLDRGTGIIVYGAASIGSLLFHRLKSLGFEVECFIDKRFWEIPEFCGKPVYAITDVAPDRNCAVLVAVKNVFEHERIAEQLYCEGFDKVIFRPADVLNDKGTQAEERLNKAYHLLTERDARPRFPIELPRYQSLGTKSLVPQGILEENKNDVTVAIPVTMLFTDRSDDCSEKPVLFLSSHLRFVKYVLGMEGGEKDSYLRYCVEASRQYQGVSVTDAWKENVLANRAEVILRMNYMANVSPSFFISKAPQASWNSRRKYFNLRSGKHRASFLAAKGYDYVPLRMSRSDYAQYLAFPDVLEAYHELKQLYDKGFAIPVENPMFYDYSNVSCHFWFEAVRKVSEIVSLYQEETEKQFNGIHIVIALPDHGFIARYLRRCGCRVISAYEQSALEKVLEHHFSYTQEEEWGLEELDFAICTDKTVQRFEGKRIIVLSDGSAYMKGWN